MNPEPIALLSSGAACVVGLSAPAVCAAVRAALSNFEDTLFADRNGEAILGAMTPLTRRRRGRSKLVEMLAMVASECFEADSRPLDGELPLLLCVAEADRPGRLAGLDAQWVPELEAALGLHFHPSASGVIAQGRASIGFALSRARELIYRQGLGRVLIAGADSLLVGRSITTYERRRRLLTSENSDGFIPGDAASAVLVGRPDTVDASTLLCTGIGIAREPAAIESGEPLRAEGLSMAVKAALQEAGCELGDLDYRLSDANGEQYHFKEAALTLSRVLRQRRDHHHLVTPADCIGEVGAAIGPLLLVLAMQAARKGYGDGPNVMVQAGSDDGLRSGLVLRRVGDLGWS